MNISWQRVLPVIVSVIIIILIAVLRGHSRVLAAITATMPINITLGLWIAFTGEADTPDARANLLIFSENLVIGLIPTLGYAVVVWLGVRAGWDFLPTILAGYAGWAVILGALMLIRASV